MHARHPLHAKPRVIAPSLSSARNLLKANSVGSQKFKELLERQELISKELQTSLQNAVDPK